MISAKFRSMPMPDAVVIISRIFFKSFKALADFSLSLRDVNLLVGPNNSGKSTIISALRVLDNGIRFARTRAPTQVFIDEEMVVGYRLPEDSIPISLENIHTNYDATESRVTFQLNNQNKLHLIFPADGGCVLLPEVPYRPVLTAAIFKREFPLALTVIPVLGPLEHREIRREKSTVISAISSHRASRHFRSYWHYFADGFDEFAQLVQQTWPGMQIRRPEITVQTSELSMFCLEGRLTRELFWVGFGFQIWCQLLTHLSRAKGTSLVVVDEPEIYLHPDVQRQLLGVIRDIGAPAIMATHSSEIMAEAEPSDIVLIDKTKRSGERLRDVSSIQRSLDLVGSAQNITLTALARSRRVLFVEGDYDFKVLRRFARKFGLSELGAGLGLTALESGGFGSWERITTLAAGIADVLGAPLMIAAVYDRDYFCQEQVDHVVNTLSKALKFAYIHSRKEIENYLLIPSALQRAIEKSIAGKSSLKGEPTENIDIHKILDDITEPMQSDVQAQILARRGDYLRSSGRDSASVTSETMKAFNERWKNLPSRLGMVSGKEVLAELRTYLQEAFGISLTDTIIIDSIRREEFPADLVGLLTKLEAYRTQSFGK
jgi:energy-coupling factor transporter ATP-binding protein EcfA2